LNFNNSSPRESSLIRQPYSAGGFLCIYIHNIQACQIVLVSPKRNREEESHCTENPIYVFPEMKLCGLVPNYYIHVSVSDLYTVFPGWVCLFGCSKIGRPIIGKYKSLTDNMNVEIVRQNIIILFWKQ
jgi:hypothetical protein